MHSFLSSSIQNGVLALHGELVIVAENQDFRRLSIKIHSAHGEVLTVNRCNSNFLTVFCCSLSNNNLAETGSQRT
jgi:hypothetical protein